MALTVFENTIDQLIRFELFRFSGGDYSGDVYTYTTYEKAVTYDGDVYEPIAVGHDGINLGLKIEEEDVKIEIDPTSGFFQFVFPDMPRRVVEVEIFEGGAQEDALDVLAEVTVSPVAIWRGRLSDVDFSKDTPVLTFRSALTRLSRMSNQRRWQRQCWHTLYKGMCGASKAAATTTVSASGLSGTTLTVPPGWEGLFDREQYLRGRIEWTGPRGLSFREIVEVSATNIVIDSTFQDFSAPQDIDIILGCDRSFAVCTAVHSAGNSFGGQRRIPVVNPLGKNTHT